MLLLEEETSSQPLYLHGLDRLIWETATDKRSFGLRMSWSEWIEAIDSVNGLDLLVWYRSSRTALMLLKKSPREKDLPPVIVNTKKSLKKHMHLGKKSIVYCGPDAEKTVKTLQVDKTHPSTVTIRSMTILA